MKTTRREVLVQGATLFACAAALPHGAFGQDQPQEFVEVKTRYGLLRGARDRGVAIFRGVPYAGSVSGANRFKAAPPLEPLDGRSRRAATRRAVPAVGPTASDREPAPAEECLFLNVWTPGPSGRKRPVMFYSHGGGFTSGSGGLGLSGWRQPGAHLGRRCRGQQPPARPHGYLFLGDLGGQEYATSGNQGMLDIRDGARMGARQHRTLRRRPRQRDDLRRKRRRRENVLPLRHAVGRSLSSTRPPSKAAPAFACCRARRPPKPR